MRPFAALLLLTCGALVCRAEPAGAPGGAPDSRVAIAHCLSPVDPQGAPSRPGRAHVARALLAREGQQDLLFQVTLRMRHFEELQARLAGGGRISAEEMDRRYLPTQAAYDATKAWLLGQGFSLPLAENNRTHLFVRGPVARISAALGVGFARVSTPEGETTSAVPSAAQPDPLLPASLAAGVLAISGLQPHLHPHTHSIRGRAGSPDIFGSTTGGFYLPSDVLGVYKAPAGLTGSGQTIAVVMGATVAASDVSGFNALAGNGRGASSFTTVPVDGGPNSTSQADDAFEGTLDVEWSGGMAPGADVRLYAIPSLDWTYIIAALDQILSDRSANAITVVTLSFGEPEDEEASSVLEGYSQTFAQLAAAGITTLSSSGDGGSSPNTDGTNGYQSSNPVEVSYPSSDPWVVGVGGTFFNTTTSVDPSNGKVDYPFASEVAWTTIPASGPLATQTYLGSGGGYSGVFARPSWQRDGGSLLGSATMRCVPDVAAPADIQSGALIYYSSSSTTGQGTSLSSPMWAGIVALLNQSRAAAGLPSLGLLGPSAYALHGSGVFTDIGSGSSNEVAQGTAGSNGAYSAGPGYDLVTGLGSPLIQPLAAALSSVSPPVITAQPIGQTVVAGNPASLSVAATVSGTVNYAFYQWSLDGSALSGATSSSYALPSVLPAQAGVYTVAVSGSAGTVTSSPATLTVILPPVILNPYTFSTLAGTALEAGSTNGTGSSALFSYPEAVAVRPDGSLAVADGGNGDIRLISAGGVVSTLAGDPGVLNNIDGTGTAARFEYPAAVFSNSAGTLMVADYEAMTIRQVGTTGVVTTIAGSTAVPHGELDGTGTAARFLGPDGIAGNAAGDLYVADFAGETIRHIAGGQVVTTLAGQADKPGSGDGTGSAALLYGPSEMAADSAGNLYVADLDNDTIRRVSAAGVVTTLAGLDGVAGTADGVGTAARFYHPNGVAVDSQGNLYVTDTGNQTIRKMSAAGVVATVAGAPGLAGHSNGTGSAAEFNAADGLAVDASGRILVADTLNDTIRAGTDAQALTASAGSPASFTVSAGGSAPLAYQWFLAGSAVAGATSSTLSLPAVQYADNGTYTVSVSNPGGTATSSPYVLTVLAAPAITAEPAPQSVPAGSAAVFSVGAAGTPPLSYQWSFNGNSVAGATSPSLTVTAAQAANAGLYQVSVVNGYGSATSAPAALTVLTAADAPVLTTAPAAQAAALGGSVRFSAAGDSPLTYQWYLNGVALGGATSSSLTVPSAQAANAGAYTVLVTNAAGSTSSVKAVLSVH